MVTSPSALSIITTGLAIPAQFDKGWFVQAASETLANDISAGRPSGWGATIETASDRAHASRTLVDET